MAIDRVRDPFTSSDSIECVMLNYDAEHRSIIASGYYESVSVPLGMFLTECGITLEDCRRAIEETD